MTGPLPQRPVRWPHWESRAGQILGVFVRVGGYGVPVGSRNRPQRRRRMWSSSAYPCQVSFTALHLSLGLPPGPLTDEILDAAIAAGVVEADDLDWKSDLPPAKGLPQTDFP